MGHYHLFSLKCNNFVAVPHRTLKFANDIFHTAAAKFEEKEQRVYMIERDLSWCPP